MAVAGRDTWRVRVRDDRGAVHGAGVLLPGNHILTCAHVVASALGADANGSCPDGMVGVDFPGCQSDAVLSAQPVRAAWAPVRKRRGDVAVLALADTPPAGAKPAALRPCGPPFVRDVRAFGHPRGRDDGIWIKADLFGSGGPGAEWVQMAGESVTGGRVERGFSGAGVVAADGSVIGCVIAHDTDIIAKIAWMVPVETMAAYWQPLTRLMTRTQPGFALTADERHRLITLLFAVTDMRSRPARNTYLSQLRRSYPRLVIDPRSESDVDQIAAVVDGCVAEPGALHELAASLERNQWNPADTSVLAELRDSLTTLLPSPLLQPEERDRLHLALDSVAPDDIASSFRDTVAPFGYRGDGAPGNPQRAITELEARNIPPGTVPPLVEFTERLAVRLTGTRAGRLRRWSDQVLDRLGTAPSAIVRLRSRLSSDISGGASPAYFVTRLEPDAMDQDRYLLTIWLQHGTSPGLPLRRDETTSTLEEIQSQVDEAFARAPAFAAEDIGTLTIEFVLPLSLLALPVDQWPIGTGAVPHGIGVDHPVVVRSLERRGALRFQDGWLRNDEWLRRNSEASCEAAVLYITAPDGPSALRRLHARLVGPGPPVGLALGFVPPPGPPSGADEISIGVEAGAVIILWCRKTPHLQRLERDLRAFLASHRVGQLPAAVWRYRVAAAASDTPEDHLGSNLAVFWDRCDRYPEPTRTYHAPDLAAE